MNPASANAAVLWTGGKDSLLALHEAHPVSLMKLQAEALALPHFLWPVSAPFAESYEAGLRWLKDTLDIGTVITGDIAEVGGSPNWIRERSRPVGLNVLTPLWGRDRLALLEGLLAARFKVVFSCVKTRWLDAGWVGRELDHQAIAGLRSLRAQNGLDLCGEEGEYHTLVTDAPHFNQRVQLGACRVRCREELAYLEIDQAELKARP
jgi:diphthine-ammonia ligase